MAVLIACCGQTHHNLVVLAVRVSVVHVPTLVLSALAAAKHAPCVVVWHVSVAAVVVSASAAASVVAKSVTVAHHPAETTGVKSTAAISRASDDTPCDGGSAAVMSRAQC